MERRAQVTAIWEIPNVSESVDLHNMADEIMGDLKDLAADGDFIEVSNPRVDVQLMPRTQQAGTIAGIPIETDESVPRGEVQVRKAEHPFADQPRVFPDGHPLAPLEDAFKRRDADAVRSCALNYCMLSRGND